MGGRIFTNANQKALKGVPFLLLELYCCANLFLLTLLYWWGNISLQY
jgi:hypothetical protein